MNRTVQNCFRGLLAPTVLGVLAILPASAAPPKHDFTVAGEYVEGCSCAAVCPCELTGLKMGCLGVGALKFSSGTYNGADLTGAKIAYATMPSKWVRLYIDAKSPAQARAVKAFGTAIYTAFGKVEETKDAKIAFTGANGKYTVKVNGGALMTLSTAPVIGGDKKTAVVHSNINDPLNPTMYQGTTVSSSYHDGPRKINLKGTNSFFNAQMQSSGKI